MIYPPNPVPAFKLEGKLEGKAGFAQTQGIQLLTSK